MFHCDYLRNFISNTIWMYVNVHQMCVYSLEWKCIEIFEAISFFLSIDNLWQFFIAAGHFWDFYDFCINKPQIELTEHSNEKD